MESRTRVATVLLALVALSLVFACKPPEWFGDGGGTPPPADILPPAPKWSGASEKLIAGKKDLWKTPAEESNFERTPSYDETIAWLRRLGKVTPEIGLFSIGKSAQGRDLWMVVVADGAAGDASALHSRGLPTVLLQAGIHSGEIDGKDAGLMLIRDIVDKKHDAGDLLKKVNLLFIPIFNVDGHELVTSYARMNQRGPSNAGWRATAERLNLNRDYMKADAPEMRAVLSVLNEWQPDLYVDLHVTDGADMQYDITYGAAPEWTWSPTIAKWMEGVLEPALNDSLQQAGHKPGPLFFPLEDGNWSAGVWGWTPVPRFSDGYGSVRHIPTLLVENHSLKPYRRRVLGTRVLLESILRTVGAEAESLRKATATDRAARPDNVPLAFKRPDKPQKTLVIDVVEAVQVPSDVTGGTVVSYTGKPVTIGVPLIESTEVVSKVTRPKAYWVPATHVEVIDRLRAHGIAMEAMRVPMTVEVEMYRLVDPAFATPGPWETNPFEGRSRISARVEVETRTETFPAGTMRIATDQPAGTLAMLLLEPESPDSFFQWGFFLECLQRVEYFEEYTAEPLARRMMYDKPELKEEFEAKLESDPAFQADPKARLRWFYERSPYFDTRWKLYPVAREK